MPTIYPSVPSLVLSAPFQGQLETSLIEGSLAEEVEKEPVVAPNPSLIEKNLDALRSQLTPGVRVAVVVKNVADAVPYVDVLKSWTASQLTGQPPSVDYLAMPNLKDAIQARSAAPGVPIMILYNTPPEVAVQMRELDVEPAATSLNWVEVAFGLLKLAPSSKKLKVHLWVDTGMGREGVPPPEAIAIAQRLAELAVARVMEIVGVATHFCCVHYAEHPKSIAALSAQIGPTAKPFFNDFDNQRMTMMQQTRFDYVWAQLQARGVLKPGVIRHAAASGAVSQGLSHLYYDMVRVGRMIIEESDAWPTKALRKRHTSHVPGGTRRLRHDIKVLQIKYLPVPVANSIAMSTPSFGSMPPNAPGDAPHVLLEQHSEVEVEAEDPAVSYMETEAEAETDAEAEAEADTEQFESEAQNEAESEAEAEQMDAESESEGASAAAAEAVESQHQHQHQHERAVKNLLTGYAHRSSASLGTGLQGLETHMGWCMGYACRFVNFLQRLQGFIAPSTAGASTVPQPDSPQVVPVAVLDHEDALTIDTIVTFRGVRLPVLLAHGYLSVVDLSPLTPEALGDLREGELLLLGPNGQGIQVTVKGDASV